MPAPAIKVELAFGSTWQTAPGSRTWTDVTSDVLQGMSWRRGASAARGQIDAGTVNLTLKNANRKYDPTYAAGAYYGNLKPGVPVRVTVTPSGGSASVQFVGTVAKWPQRYDLSNDWATVPVAGFDGIANFARARIPQGVLAAAILALSPDGYWPLSDPNQSLTAFDATGAQLATASDTPEFGSDILSPGLRSSCKFDGVNDRLDITRSALIPDVKQCTVVAVVRTATTPSGSGSFIFAQRESGQYAYLFIDENGIATFEWLQSLTSYAIYGANAAGSVLDNSGHLIIGQGNDGGSDYGIAVDSSTLVTTTGGGIGSANGIGCAIGGPPFRTVGTGVGYFTGQISDVAVWDRALTDAERATVHTGWLALDGQTTDQRIGYVLDQIGWPAGLRSLETGRTVLGAATFQSGDIALDYLRAVEASESGRLFIDRQGQVRFLDRYYPYLTSTSSGFTFTDANTDKSYSTLDLDIDDELLCNIARVTRRGGAEQVATNTASITTHGPAEIQLTDMILSSDAEARSLAEWLVATRSTPLPRVPSIRIPFHRYSAADQGTVLALDIGARVTVTRTPQALGAAITKDYLIDGIAHEAGGKAHWVTFYLCPVVEDTVSLFRWGVSEWGGTHVWAF